MKLSSGDRNQQQNFLQYQSPSHNATESEQHTILTGQHHRQLSGSLHRANNRIVQKGSSLFMGKPNSSHQVTEQAASRYNDAVGMISPAPVNYFKLPTPSGNAENR